MKMCKTIPMFILFFVEKSDGGKHSKRKMAGYLCNNMDVAMNTTTASHSFSPPSKVTQAPESKTTPHGSDYVPEKEVSTVLVAGISISIVFLLILVIAGVWYASKKSRESSAEINSVPSGEPGPSSKKISTRAKKKGKSSQL